MLFEDEKQKYNPDNLEAETEEQETPDITSYSFVLSLDARLFLQACLREGRKFMTKGERQHLQEVIKKTIINNPSNVNVTQDIIDRTRDRLENRHNNFMILFPYLFKSPGIKQMDPEPKEKTKSTIYLLSVSGKNDLKLMLKKYRFYIFRSEKKYIKELLKNNPFPDSEDISKITKIMARVLTRCRNRKANIKMVFPFLF